jgi:hypothetical protein
LNVKLDKKQAAQINVDEGAALEHALFGAMKVKVPKKKKEN